MRFQHKIPNIYYSCADDTNSERNKMEINTIERIHPATPKEDAHIESFNSILEKDVVRRFEFSSFNDAMNTIERFIAFYNNERLHSAIGYKAPREVYEEWKESLIEK